MQQVFFLDTFIKLKKSILMPSIRNFKVGIIIKTCFESHSILWSLFYDGVVFYCQAIFSQAIVLSR